MISGVVVFFGLLILIGLLLWADTPIDCPHCGQTQWTQPPFPATVWTCPMCHGKVDLILRNRH